MKVDKQIFLEFIKKVSLDGNIEDLVFHFDNDGLKIRAKNLGNTLVVAGKLNSTSFKTYQPLENKVGIKGIKQLMNITKRLGNEITITINSDKNLLNVFDDKRKLSLSLMEVEYCDSYIKVMPDVEIANEFKLNGEIFHNSKAVHDSNNVKIKLIVKDNKLKFETDIGILGKFIERDSFDCKDIKLEFGQPLIDVINVLGNDLYISLEENKPLFIKEKTEDYFIKYIIAPRV